MSRGEKKKIRNIRWSQSYNSGSTHIDKCVLIHQFCDWLNSLQRGHQFVAVTLNHRLKSTTQDRSVYRTVMLCCVNMQEDLQIGQASPTLVCKIKFRVLTHLDLFSGDCVQLWLLSNGEGIDKDLWAGSDCYFEVVTYLLNFWDALDVFALLDELIRET